MTRWLPDNWIKLSNFIKKMRGCETHLALAWSSSFCCMYEAYYILAEYQYFSFSQGKLKILFWKSQFITMQWLNYFLRKRKYHFRNYWNVFTSMFRRKYAQSMKTNKINRYSPFIIKFKNLTYLISLAPQKILEAYLHITTQIVEHLLNEYSYTLYIVY